MDTTYLLPFFGVDIKLEHFDSEFPKIVRRFEVLYNQASLIEAKWIIISMLKKEKQKEKKMAVLQRYIDGLETLAAPDQPLGNILNIVQARAERVADHLLFDYDVGDYFDRLIYSSAAIHEAILLTEDHRLIEIQRMDEDRAKTSVGNKHGSGKVEYDTAVESMLRPRGVINWDGLLRNPNL